MDDRENSTTKAKQESVRHLPVIDSFVDAKEGSSDDIPEEQLLRVGDLAQETGKTVRAIHLYEELGLLRPRSRSKGRYRLFGPDAIVRTRWISKLQELGMSLNDIRTVIHQWESLSAPGAMTRMREVYHRQLQETRNQLVRLRSLESELSASLRYLESCDSCDPDRLISACQQCEMHHDDAPPD
jgi:DNA-binding transcriptional MerR regulator